MGWRQDRDSAAKIMGDMFYKPRIMRLGEKWILRFEGEYFHSPSWQVCVDHLVKLDSKVRADPWVSV